MIEVRLPEERPQLLSITTVARQQLRATLRGRWFWMWTAAFVGLAVLLVVVALPNIDTARSAAFGRTSASLVTLVQVIVPLMGLTLGALAIAAPRESGALQFLLSHPVNRTEVFAGTFLGLAAGLGVSIAGGFGIAGLLTAPRGVASQAAVLLWIALLAWLLAMAMLSVGMAISTFAHTSGSALGMAVFSWLVFVFLGDLGVMATWVATRLPVGLLFAAAVVNPVEAFRLASLTAFSGSLDMLGPAGTFAIDSLGAALTPALAASLGAWVVVPLAVAWWRFGERSDV